MRAGLDLMGMQITRLTPHAGTAGGRHEPARRVIVREVLGSWHATAPPDLPRHLRSSLSRWLGARVSILLGAVLPTTDSADSG